jgi:hypothetical protein
MYCNLESAKTKNLDVVISETCTEIFVRFLLWDKYNVFSFENLHTDAMR